MQRRRRIMAIVGIAIVILATIFQQLAHAPQPVSQPPPTDTKVVQTPISQAPAVSPPSAEAPSSAVGALATVLVKGRAPKTGYARTQFGDGWLMAGNCDTRNSILRRDLANVVVSDTCKVLSGTLADPYTGMTISFVRGKDTSASVQIDHVVALSNAWQTGAQQMTREQRIALANDPLELLAVYGAANQAKSDSDAATWLPPNKAFRCQYVARQIAVKAKYALWVTQAEKDAMNRVLGTCPDQQLPAAMPTAQAN